MDRMLGAAQAVGADAVHPGYGFLAENADFAARCADAGLIFIGPPVEAIRQHGQQGRGARDHGEGRRAGRARRVGRRTRRRWRWRSEAKRLGLPLLIKASAGGGGKGMRLVRDAAAAAGRAGGGAARGAAARSATIRCCSSATSKRPRHVELQIFGDAQGHVVHLFERECSIQRRFQKIIEEAPSVAVDADPARPHGRRGGRGGAGHRLHRRRHRRVHPRPRRPVLLPRGQHAAAGRAPGHRGDHRARPGRAADPRRPRRAAAVRRRTICASRDTPSRRASTPRIPPRLPARDRAHCALGAGVAPGRAL